MDEESRKFALSVAVDLHKVWLKRGDIECSVERQLDDIQYIAARFYEFIKGVTL